MSETYTTLDEAPFRLFHYKITAYTAGGNFVDGYILGIISIALALIGPQMHMSSVWLGLIGSSALIGIFFGALIGGPLSDKIGRQLIYTIHFVILVVFSILQFWVNTPATLFLIRIVLGLSIGAEYALGAPLLIEFTPKKQRGIALSITQVAWALGYVVSAVVGYLMKDNGPDAWRWLLVSQAVPGALIMLLRIGTPESPRWLVSKGRYDEARAIVKKVIGPDVDIEDLINDKQTTTVNLGVKYLFTRNVWRRTAFSCLFYSCMNMPFFAIFTFAPTVLTALHVQGALMGTLLLQGFIMLGSILGMFVVNLIPRRPFLIYSFVITFAIYLLLGVLVNPAGKVVLLLFLIYALVAGAAANLLNIYPPELFPTEVRATGVGITVCCSRIGAAISTFALPVIMSSLGLHATMIILSCVFALGGVVSIMWAPETGKKSLNEASNVSSL